MRKTTAELARHRIKRARATFQEALTLLETKALAGAINRFYYAAFYAARALLAIKELDSAKHSGVISLFHQHFVKTGLVDVEKSKALSRSFEERQDSDYEDFAAPTLDEVTDVRDRVRQFLDECEKVLDKLSSGPSE